MNVRDRIVHGDALTINYTDAWLEYFRGLDIEHPTLTELSAARDEIDRLRAVAEDLQAATPGDDAVTPRLQGTAPTASDALKAAKRGKGYTADEIKAARAAIDDRLNGAARVYTAGFDRFTRNGLIASLTPHHDRLVERAVEIAENLPDGLAREEDARFGGRLPEWNELGAVLAELTMMRTLVGDLREKAYLATRGARPEDSYLSAEFEYANVHEALPYLAWNSRIGMARALKHGRPALLRVQEIDELRSTAPEPPARDDAAYYARVRRQQEVEAWTAAGRQREERQRMREFEERASARSREALRQVSSV